MEMDQQSEFSLEKSRKEVTVEELEAVPTERHQQFEKAGNDYFALNCMV